MSNYGVVHKWRFGLYKITISKAKPVGSIKSQINGKTRHSIGYFMVVYHTMRKCKC